MPNRLAAATSPYLRQHKENPIDWFPWGEEAFLRARLEDKPVFLSIGYSSCHWCHVMAHESFEDPEVAILLNREFVSIKVDREERPDVDEAYMLAVQLVNGHGGWPMSLFLTPDKKPFFAGTYFPKLDRGRSIGFLTLCERLAELWRTQRSELTRSASELASGIAQLLRRTTPVAKSPLDGPFLSRAVDRLAESFDWAEGGFGGAPKFPPHSALSFLLRAAESSVLDDETQALAARMAGQTLDRMAAGGIHDHVGGGFHRYSTDNRWLLPHFEKMLYDNAMLLGAYARASRSGGEGKYDAVAERIVDWLEREMTSPEGFFYSALDADSEGEEGIFYLWTEEELRGLLGDEAEPFLAAYGVEREGNFHDEATRQLTGSNILHQTRYSNEFAEELALLKREREGRIRPGLDDKALAAWNGMAIEGLVEAGRLDLASRCAEAWLAAESSFGRLPHQVTQGQPSGQPYLDDLAHMAAGLIALATVGGQSDYRKAAERYVRLMLSDYRDGSAFTSTSEQHERLFGRSRPAHDSATPSPSSVAIRCLIALGLEDEAREAMVAVAGWAEQTPEHSESLLEAILIGLQRGMVWTQTPGAGAPTVAAPEPAKLDTQVLIEVSDRELRPGPDGWAEFTITLRIPNGFHVNSPEPPARWLVPTQVSASPAELACEYPPAVNDRYEGEVAIPARVRYPGRPLEFELRVSYQACTERECLLPTEKAFDMVVR